MYFPAFHWSKQFVDFRNLPGNRVVASFSTLNQRQKQLSLCSFLSSIDLTRSKLHLKSKTSFSSVVFHVTPAHGTHVLVSFLMKMCKFMQNIINTRKFNVLAFFIGQHNNRWTNQKACLRLFSDATEPRSVRPELCPLTTRITLVILSSTYTISFIFAADATTP